MSMVALENTGEHVAAIARIKTDLEVINWASKVGTIYMQNRRIS
jgi:hypothetical protein